MHRAHAEPVPWFRSSPPFEVRARGRTPPVTAPGDLTPRIRGRIVRRPTFAPPSRACRRPRSTCRPAPWGHPTSALRRSSPRTSPASSPAARHWPASRCGCGRAAPSPCSGRTALARRRSCGCWPRPSGRRTAAPRVDGLDVDRDAELVRERVAYLSHATGLYDDLTARENLEFAAPMLATPDPADAGRARALDDVGLADARRRPGRGPSRPACAGGWRSAGSFSDRRRSSCSTSRRPRSTRTACGLVEQLLEAWREVGVSVLVAVPQHRSTRALARRARRRSSAASSTAVERQRRDVARRRRRSASRPPGGCRPMSALRREAPDRDRRRPQGRDWPSCAGAQRDREHALLRRGRAPPLRLRARARCRPPGRRRAGPPVAGDRLRRASSPSSRLHLLETDDGALEQLAAYPVARRAIYAGKALGGFAVMLRARPGRARGRGRDPLRRRHRSAWAPLPWS